MISKPKRSFGQRTVSEETVFVDKDRNFHYIQRGIDKTPEGTTVAVHINDRGESTTETTLNKIRYALRNHNGYFRNQYIAWSYDPQDLILLAIEHGWKLLRNENLDPYLNIIDELGGDYVFEEHSPTDN